MTGTGTGTPADPWMLRPPVLARLGRAEVEEKPRNRMRAV